MIHSDYIASDQHHLIPQLHSL